MAFTVMPQRVLIGQAIGNVDASGNVETRGAVVFGKVDVTSYANGGEVISAAALGLNEIYNAQFWMSENDTYAPRSFEVAAGNKSGTLNIDTAGSGTEVSAAVDVGELSFIAWGETLGSGTN